MVQPQESFCQRKTQNTGWNRKRQYDNCKMSLLCTVGVVCAMRKFKDINRPRDGETERAEDDDLRCVVDGWGQCWCPCDWYVVDTLGSQARPAGWPQWPAALPQPYSHLSSPPTDWPPRQPHPPTVTSSMMSSSYAARPRLQCHAHVTYLYFIVQWEDISVNQTSTSR